MPMPLDSVSRSPFGSRLPKPHEPRRLITLPHTTFSPMACLSNEAIAPGATIGTAPEATSSASTTPRTPP